MGFLEAGGGSFLCKQLNGLIDRQSNSPPNQELRYLTTCVIKAIEALLRYKVERCFVYGV